MISSLYNKYFQKSKVFLFPLLEFPKTKLISSVQTFIIWENRIRQEDCKLVCLYNDVESEEFKDFEMTHVRTSPYFHESYVNSENQGIYIFDMHDYYQDWKYFLKGKYSYYTDNSKLLIKRYYGSKSEEYKYIQTYLNPSDHYKVYSELLGVKEETLKEVGELCDVYDVNKEFLKFTPINLEVTPA